jgi:hypothetical protein
MKKRINIICWLLIILLVSIYTCDLPTQPGPMPKDLIDLQFEPGLNIFGVLRADSIAGSSFFHVERAVKTKEMYEGGDLADTTATVQLTDTLTNETFWFNPATDTAYDGYYYNSNFMPQPEHHYQLEIQSAILPTLQAETTVPRKPVIVHESLDITSQQLSFDLQLSSDTYQYNVYLNLGNYSIEKQFSNNRDGTVKIEFEFPSGQQPAGLTIIGYDQNLTTYLNSSPSFIPQTFHEMVITVENGYGCFGSLAVTNIRF